MWLRRLVASKNRLLEARCGELRVRVTGESAADCISALQGNWIISGNFGRWGSKFNRCGRDYNFHNPCIPQTSGDCSRFWAVSGAGAILHCDGTLSWLHWKVLMLDVKQSRCHLGKDGVWWSSLTAQPREKWNLVGSVWVWVRRQRKMAGTKHFWHTTAPIHVLLWGFLEGDWSHSFPSVPHFRAQLESYLWIFNSWRILRLIYQMLLCKQANSAYARGQHAETQKFLKSVDGLLVRPSQHICINFWWTDTVKKTQLLPVVGNMILCPWRPTDGVTKSKKTERKAGHLIL